MSGPGLARVRPAALCVRVALQPVAHLVFFIVVAAALVRLFRMHSTLCWDMVTVSALFAGVYAAGLTLWGRLGAGARHVWVAALLLLWTVLVLLAPGPLTGAYVWCAVPLACAALRALGHRAAKVAVGAVTVVLVGQLSGGAGGFDAETVLVPVAAVWGTVALYRGQQREAAERQRLVEELRGTRDVLAREQRRAGVLEERARIAGDLHDTLAQELSGSLMLLQAAERDWEDRPEVARTRVRAVADGLDAGLAETRRIIRDLTPPTVAEAGLEASLRLLCARAELDGTAAQVRFHSTTAHHLDLDEQSATTLLRVARGLLANVREHARATRLLVTLHHHPDRVELEVHDDGVGFTGTTSAPDRGYGLPSARARLRTYGGELDVDSTPGRGTRVRAVLPVHARSGPAVPVASTAVR